MISEELSLALSPEQVETLQRTSATPGWFEGLRSAAADRLRTVPAPTASDELWRYTNPDHFDFSKMLERRGLAYTLEGSSQGRSAPRIATGSELTEADEALVREVLEIDREESAVALFQIATLGSVTVISIPRNWIGEVPLRLIAEKLEGRGTLSSLIVIDVQPGAQVKIIEELDESYDAFTCPRVEIFVRENAGIFFASIQRMSDDQKLLARHRVQIQRDGRAEVVHIGTGAKTGRVDFDCRLLGPGASADLVSAFLLDGRRHLDLHATQDHVAPHCHSNLYSKAALKDNGHNVYYGYIKVGEEAQKTDAYQTNRNLVLSPSARADAIPNLEIKANDVRCSHGASVGQVSQDELFYLLSRGLTKAAAEHLLVEGFFLDALKRISVPEVAEAASALLLERLHRSNS